MRRRTLLATLLATGAAACVDQHAFEITPEAAGVGTRVEIFTASTRAAPDLGREGSARGPGVLHGRYGISVPPNRRPGSLPRARLLEPDPARHFLISDSTAYEGRAAFRAALSRALDASPGREAVIFVHGFNTTFPDGLYRQAQIIHDLHIPGVAVHLAWPSSGNALTYIYDRESALFSRSALEDLIRDVDAAGAETIVLVAHSMGSLLSMEALRQMAIRDGGRPGVQLDGVVLLAPDIDVTLFRQMAREVGTLPEPFAIVSSAADPALLLSALLSGETSRLGNVADPRSLSDMPVTVIDITDFTPTARNLHWTATTSPLLIQILDQVGALDAAYAQDTPATLVLIPGTVVTLRRATQIILSPGLLVN